MKRVRPRRSRRAPRDRAIRPRAGWALSAVLAVLGLASPVVAADPFYERRQEEGVLAYDRGDYQAAVRDFRIAAFGLLEEPPELAACLAHLALAQAALGDREAFDATFLRLAEVERRFDAYSAAPLASGVRRALVERLRAWVESERLEAFLGTPSLPVKEPSAPGETSPAETGASEAGELAEASDAPVEVQETVSAERSPDEPSDDVAAELERARRVLAGSDRREELAETFGVLRDLANRHAEHRELRFLVAETAYRLRFWEEAVEHFRGRGEGDGPRRPDRQFYLAVALYESGDRTAAAEVLDRCLPRLSQNDFVRGYVVKIRGTGG